jgi:catalase
MADDVRDPSAGRPASSAGLPAPGAPKPPLSPGAVVLRLGVIGAVVLCSAAAFAYTGGWLSPGRLGQKQIIAGFDQTDGVHPGFRRNHAKGICATGWFESNGNAVPFSKAALFAPGRVPVVARIAFAGGLPFVPDAPDLVRSLALRFQPAGAGEWRTGMLNIPVFPFTTAEAFHDQMLAFAPDAATGKPDPAKMGGFVGTHPEFLAAVGSIEARAVSSGFADAAYHALHTFHFINAAGTVTPVKWSTVPMLPFTAPGTAPVTDKNALFDGFIGQVNARPVQWRLMVTIGQPGDPVSPNLPWPADRKQIDAGMVTLDHVASEDGGGPCIDVNYDPLVLPSGIEASDDPLLSARSSAYARSFKLREGEHAEKPPSAVTPAEVAAGGRS